MAGPTRLLKYTAKKSKESTALLPTGESVRKGRTVEVDLVLARNLLGTRDADGTRDWEPVVREREDT